MLHKMHTIIATMGNVTVRECWSTPPWYDVYIDDEPVPYGTLDQGEAFAKMVELFAGN